MATVNEANKKSGGSTLRIIVIVVLLMAFSGGAVYFYANTIVEWWLPTAISVAGALILWVPLKKMWARGWPDGAVVVRLLVHLVILTALIECSLLAANSIGADTAATVEQSAQVVRKYEQKQYRSRRLGTRRYIKGEPYYTYHIELLLPDQRRKTLTLSREHYNRVAQNRPYPLTIAPGLLGWPVIMR